MIYGTLGAVIVLLLWLYLASMMLIMGAEFNSVLMVMRRTEHTPVQQTKKSEKAKETETIKETQDAQKAIGDS